LGSAPPAPGLALVGGTVLDLAQGGREAQDLKDATVLVRDGLIAAVGPRASVALPDGTRVIDVTGKYLIPGLVDGFTGLNSQAQASAHLYMGVTTVVGSGDDRRGRLFLQAHPGPHLYLMDGTGSTDNYDLLVDRPEWRAKLRGRDPDVELSWEDSSRMMDEQARMGVRALWLGWNLTAANTARIVAKARSLGLATYGEFISTPFADGIADGVHLLLHMNRYTLGLVTVQMQHPLVGSPYGAAAGATYAFADEIPASDPRVAAYGRLIAARHVALMPTLGLYYADLPGHRNLWTYPVARILDPKGMFHPTDPATGDLPAPSAWAKRQIEASVLRSWEQDRVLLREHPVVLAASGSAVFGSLPGISLHVEMELLVRAGLAPREALAAATSNYAEQFGWPELGLVAPGRRADLLVLEADPTALITNSTSIRMVLLDGVPVDRAALLGGPGTGPASR
jgi:hypothetical protein